MSITIRLKRNGPYQIAADQATLVTVVDADGKILVPEPGRSIALCRCGGSSTKPFCDGTHRRNGFVGTTEPGGPSVQHETTEPAASRLRTEDAEPGTSEQ